MYDSLKVMGLGFVASETEFKVQFWAMSRIYHPGKHKTEHTVMVDEDKRTPFKIFNNAHSYLREVLWNDSVLGFFVCVKVIIPVKIL